MSARLLILGAVCAAATSLGACGRSAAPASAPALAVSAKAPVRTSRELFRFSDLPSMVATSPLVIDATVTALQPGDEDGAGESQEAFANATLQINACCAGTRPARR